MDINKSKFIENYTISKLWNTLIDNKSSKAENAENYCANLDNYAFRMNIIIKEPESKLIQMCRKFIDAKSNLNKYLTQNNEQSFTSQANVELIELLDTSNSKPTASTNAPIEVEMVEKKEAPEKYEISDEKMEVVPIVSLDTNNQEHETHERLEHILFSLKKNLEDSNTDELKATISDISTKLSVDSIKKISKSVLNIENYNGTLIEDVLEMVSLKEDDLISILESMISINESESLLSYSVLNAILSEILGDYILIRLKLKNETKEASIQIDSILSRKVFAICSQICKQFTRPFMFSCLSNWIKCINESSKSKSSTLLLEFVNKLIKECFGESEAIALIQHLVAEFTNLKWSENVYLTMTNLVDKIANINLENFSIIIDKMQIDSKDLCKSTVFTKLIINLINKYKQVSATSSSSSSNNDYLKDKLLVIIENNQTILKKSLMTNFSKLDN